MDFAETLLIKLISTILILFSMGVEVSGDLVTSILIVNNAGDSDAGSYSCTLPVFGNMDFPRARANVHLIYGKINEVNLDTICHL